MLNGLNPYKPFGSWGLCSPRPPGGAPSPGPRCLVSIRDMPLYLFVPFHCVDGLMDWYLLRFNISEAFPYPGITGENWSPSREIPGFNFFLNKEKLTIKKLIEISILSYIIFFFNKFLFM